MSGFEIPLLSLTDLIYSGWENNDNLWDYQRADKLRSPDLEPKQELSLG